ncbi:hypothetical protein CBR_g61471 [Chara braunii]|uniref:Glutamine amidotransferase domain-containing protein n=1 Tax=Chara braunii TaxID=69332 RepID=A0A388K8Q1_CHABU|nr:hypothetical protein CBR_g61471 [Chara braunii]|eukprot:GBG66428.1 hypothetical protein CBR_g61471 [Chara braunii]
MAGPISGCGSAVIGGARYSSCSSNLIVAELTSTFRQERHHSSRIAISHEVSFGRCGHSHTLAAACCRSIILSAPNCKLSSTSSRLSVSLQFQSGGSRGRSVCNQRQRLFLSPHPHGPLASVLLGPHRYGHRLPCPQLKVTSCGDGDRYGGLDRPLLVSRHAPVAVNPGKSHHHLKSYDGPQQPALSLATATRGGGIDARLLHLPRARCTLFSHFAASSCPSSSSSSSSLPSVFCIEVLPAQSVTPERRRIIRFSLGRYMSFAANEAFVQSSPSTSPDGTDSEPLEGRAMKDKKAGAPRGRFAVLITGYPPKPVAELIGGEGSEGYDRLFIDMLRDPGEHWDVFRVVDGEFPSEEDWDLYDGFVLTGSGKDAHGSDPWIQQLANMLVKLNDERRKILGVCFGHQEMSVSDME